MALDASSITRGLTVAGFVYVIVHTLRQTPDLARGPWRLIMVGGVFALLHAVARLVHAVLVDEAYPFPSPVEPLAFAAYGFMIAGALRMVRLRTLERRREDSTDAAIVALTVAMVVLNVLSAPYIHDAGVAVLDRVIVVGYAACVLALTGVVARIAFGPGQRNEAYYLLAASAAVIIINDVLLRGFIAGWSWGLDTANTVAPIAFVFAAAAIAHPDVVHLTDRPEHAERAVTSKRLVPLAGAILVGPAILVAAEFNLFSISRIGTICGTALLGLLVLLRMVDLVRSKETSISSERSLREAATRLATATDREAVLLTAIDGLLGISTEQFSSRVSLYRVEANELVLETSRGLQQHAVHGTVSKATLTEAGVHDFLRAVMLEDVTPLDESSDERLFQALVPFDDANGAWFVAMLTQREVFTREQVASLNSFATQVSLALESVHLRENMHIRRSNRRFQALVENSSDVVVVLDASDTDTVSFASATVRRLLGRSEEDVVGVSVLSLVHRRDRDNIRQLLASPARDTGSRQTTEVRLLHGSGELRWFEVEARDLRGDDEVSGIVVTASDIADRKRAEAQLLRSEARFRLLVQNSSDVVGILDSDNLFTYISPSVEAMLGFSPHHMLGRNVFEMLSMADAERIRGVEAADLDGQVIEVRVQTESGDLRAIEVAITDMRSEPEVDGIVLNIRDVTERRSLEDDLRHKALHDDLTGLANRAFFTERVNEAIRAPQRDGEIVAVLFVDLDDFKLINDSLGHVIGDQVLVSVADRIQQCLRLRDVAARLGGDEFAVLLSGVYGASELAEVADRVREALRVPVRVGDQELPLSASIGIASDLDATRTGDDLLRTADLAMYRAKQAGKDRIQLFEDHMETSAFEELEIKSALARGIENNEFVLHYQPIIDMATSQIRGVEALVRWEDPNRGMVSPASFIPIAEETGLIRPLGMWIARQASSDLAQWREMGFDIYCSINVSGRQMDQEGFAERFIDAIRESGVSTDSIIVELTESVLAASGVSTIFDKFHDVGFRIALDDFGTGYSAFQYLQSFNIDIIKIDRAFVQALNTDADAGVIEAVLDVARRIGAKTVAEGIEETNEARSLRAIGVELGQGYYFSRPVEAARLIGLLEDERSGKMPENALTT